MEKNKGKFGYINKKLVAGTISLTLLTISLTGCSNTGFTYVKNDQGQYELVDEVDYNDLKDCYFIVIENPDYEKTEFYICKRSVTLSSEYHYTDLFTDKRVFSRKSANMNSTNEESKRILLEEIKLEDYVYANREEKMKYSKEDLEEMFEQLKSIYGEKNKQLVKE